MTLAQQVVHKINEFGRKIGQEERSAQDIRFSAQPQHIQTQLGEIEKLKQAEMSQKASQVTQFDTVMNADERAHFIELEKLKKEQLAQMEKRLVSVGPIIRPISDEFMEGQAGNLEEDSDGVEENPAPEVAHQEILSQKSLGKLEEPPRVHMRVPHHHPEGLPEGLNPARQINLPVPQPISSPPPELPQPIAKPIAVMAAQESPPKSSPVQEARPQPYLASQRLMNVDRTRSQLHIQSKKWPQADFRPILTTTIGTTTTLFPHERTNLDAHSAVSVSDTASEVDDEAREDEIEKMKAEEFDKFEEQLAQVLDRTGGQTQVVSLGVQFFRVHTHGG